MILGLFILATGALVAAPQRLQAEWLTCECPHFYVDALVGEDTELCGPDPAFPCRTIQAAIDRIPIVFHRDIVVHVASGVYPGGILISGRTTPNRSRVRVVGEAEGTIVSGPAGETTGVSVIQSHNVVLENLDIRGFPDAGVRVMFSPGARLESLSLSNNGDGAFLGESDTVVRRGVFNDNLRNGVACQGGWVAFTGDSAPHAFVGNAGAGIMAAGCHVNLESQVSISGSLHGLLAVHGGEINLNLRPDISVYAGTSGSGLTADCHGMITGFENSCVGSCTCTAVRYGICEAGLPSSGGGGRRSPVYVEND